MNANQATAFWSMAISFIVVATSILYEQGAFESIQSPVGAGIIALSYLAVVFLIRTYVVTHPDEIESWFR